MAVPKRKTSRARRGDRRAHDSLTNPTLATDATGKKHRRHHISADGFYRGRKVLETESDDNDE